jgi:hypothetical protein
MVGVASVWWSAMESAGYALDGPVYDTILRQVRFVHPRHCYSSELTMPGSSSCFCRPLS